MTQAPGVAVGRPAAAAALLPVLRAAARAGPAGHARGAAAGTAPPPSGASGRRRRLQGAVLTLRLHAQGRFYEETGREFSGEGGWGRVDGGKYR